MAFQEPRNSGGAQSGNGGPVTADALRDGFRGEGQAELAAGRARAARRARGWLALGVAVMCLVLVGVRLGRGDGVGVWMAFYFGGSVVSGLGFVLAKNGRTRWATAAILVGVGLASFGDNPLVR